jgi:hypothetical protein
MQKQAHLFFLSVKTSSNPLTTFPQLDGATAFSYWTAKAEKTISVPQSWGVAQVVDLLSNKCEALDSNPTTSKKRKYKPFLFPSNYRKERTHIFHQFHGFI